jgi:EAL domain-containing protein (putative c-di-GMP-specific phosphodiesterase class I)
MTDTDSELLLLIDSLHEKIRKLGERATKPDQKERAIYAEQYLRALANMLEKKGMVFCIEPWHALDNDGGVAPGEMLLRVKDATGQAMAPYPAIMTFYHNGFTAELDTILALSALKQFRESGEKQVSINISCRSLQDPGFVKAVLTQLESMKLTPEEKILFEIHESNASVKINPKTLAMLKQFNVGFALDDVGLSMNDVFRLSSFEHIADYIKLDRESIGANPDDPRSLAQILALAKSLLPEAIMVAEGIKSAEHAREILKIHPGIRFVQGMHLPDRETFSREWNKPEQSEKPK